jgi:hypothetical protein
VQALLRALHQVEHWQIYLFFKIPMKPNKNEKIEARPFAK